MSKLKPGTSADQGVIWGARAQDWLRYNEPAWQPVFREVLDELGVLSGTRYLDLGCGAGGALVLAHLRGADTAGLDASEALAGIARERLPDARIVVGDLEDLPFRDGAFDAVSGINSFQFAGNSHRAVAEAARVCRKGGRVGILTWGPREECELVSSVMAAAFALLPPAPPTPSAFGKPGEIEALFAANALTGARTRYLDAELAFPDLEAGVRACLAASARIIAHAGEDRVRQAIEGGMTRFVRADGSVRLRNRFRIVSAVRA